MALFLNKDLNIFEACRLTVVLLLQLAAIKRGCKIVNGFGFVYYMLCSVENMLLKT